MVDPKEQELIDACVEASRNCVEAARKSDEAYRKSVEAEHKLRKYQESKAQQGRKAGE